MNLNSYLPLPTAPRNATPLANSPAQGPASGADAVAGQGLGLDFAQIMAQQLQQLPASQRQSFAATSKAIHAESAQAAEQAALSANKDAASQAQNQDKTAPKKTSKNQARNRLLAAPTVAAKPQRTTKTTTWPQQHLGRATCHMHWPWLLRPPIPSPML